MFLSFDLRKINLSFDMLEDMNHFESVGIVYLLTQDPGTYIGSNRAGFTRPYSYEAQSIDNHFDLFAKSLNPDEFTDDKDKRVVPLPLIKTKEDNTIKSISEKHKDILRGLSGRKTPEE